MGFLEKYFNKVPEIKRDSAAIAYLAALDHISKNFSEVAQAVIAELKDQRSYLKLIASENYCSLATQLSMGNLLTDKYSEGYVKHRFYAGCDNVDTIEDLAMQELKTLFDCEHAYVQPHSGADANLVAIWAILIQKIQNKGLEKLGKKSLEELSSEEYETIRKHLVSQKLLGMSLNSGGHLTHGYRHNISSKIMQSFSYDVNPKTMLLDYDALVKQAELVKPLILLAGYSAYPRLINFAKMREIADQVGAVLMVDMAHFAGLVAGKALTGDFNPVPFAHVVTSTTHKTLRGPRGGMILCKEEFKDNVNKGCPLVLGGPLPHVMAAKAVAFREACLPSFKEYAKQIIKNAQSLAETLKRKGVHLFTGGTDNHLIVADVWGTFGITGRQAENALRRAGMTVNRNTIPFDVNGPWYTSGIRIGTPALTTLGMKEDEMKKIGELIYDLLKATTQEQGSKAKVVIDEKNLSRVKKEVDALLKGFPLYPEIVLT